MNELSLKILDILSKKKFDRCKSLQELQTSGLNQYDSLQIMVSLRELRKRGLIDAELTSNVYKNIELTYMGQRYLISMPPSGFLKKISRFFDSQR